MPRDRSEFDDLAPLIKLIRAHPPFDRETELVVTRKARKGDKRAQEKLVVHNLSLVISVARKFMGRGVRLEDLVQEGNYGLLKAIEHFDPEKGNRFSTYAVWWIRAYITRCLKDGPSAVRRTSRSRRRWAPTATAAPRTSIGWPTKDRARMPSFCVPSRTKTCAMRWAAFASGWASWPGTS